MLEVGLVEWFAVVEMDGTAAVCPGPPVLGGPKAVLNSKKIQFIIQIPI